MIRGRVVAMLGVFVLLLAGFAGYDAFGRTASEFTGATDPAHVAAAKAMLAGLAAPAGMTLDPYRTGCDLRGSYCLTSTTVEPETAAVAMTNALVAQGGRVRSHVCGGRDLVEHACRVVVDYQGSAIDFIASHGRRGNALTRLRLSVSGEDSPQLASASVRYGSWASVDPLPAAWTTGVTCLAPSPAGCSRYSQSSAASPVIRATTAEACATVRRLMEGRYSMAVDKDAPATATDPAGCVLLGHRYRTVGGTDGEMLSVRVYTRDAGHVVVGVSLMTWS